MTSLFRCDWCEEVYEDRTRVSLCDFGQTGTDRIHICQDCLPDHIKSHLDLQEHAP